MFANRKNTHAVFLSILWGVIPMVTDAGSECEVVRRANEAYGTIHNREAVIPPQCYTKANGISNPCWTCHTERNGRNRMDDWALQLEYAFSEQGKTNHWSNLFMDRRAAMAEIPAREVLEYIREDNYSTLRKALNDCADYGGWRPDLDFRKGFDEEGFARDGSWWRAFRYKPFPGTFWPTNGSTDDIFIRLPWQFYTNDQGEVSRDIYKLNLAILEAAMTVPDTVVEKDIRRRIEPIDESAVGRDVNGDGSIAGVVTAIKGLPAHYAGAASRIAVERYSYPAGTEFLHTVRYVDPDKPNLLSTRMKEVRYSVKRVWSDGTALALAYVEEKDHKERGLLPLFRGSPDAGLMNDFGWQLQGFIEDGEGRLRAQTQEETYYCMGCHGSLGVTVDQTFGFPRKVPGKAGWGHQDLRGIHDVPQAGHGEPEILTYFKRVGGGDEFRANEEIRDRFFLNGQVKEELVRQAAPGGSKDIAWLLTPSRERALDLNRAYMVLVREQSFERGRDVVLKPPRNVHKRIENGSTGFDERQGIYRDGRLWLDWKAAPAAKSESEGMIRDR